MYDPQSVQTTIINIRNLLAVMRGTPPESLDKEVIERALTDALLDLSITQDTVQALLQQRQQKQDTNEADNV